MQMLVSMQGTHADRLHTFRGVLHTRQYEMLHDIYNAYVVFVCKSLHDVQIPPGERSNLLSYIYV